MTPIVIILLILIVIIVKFFLDRDKMLQKQVDSQGGMKQKYKYLIDELSQGDLPQFVEVTRDHIYFRFPGNPTTINYYITEHFGGKVQIEWLLQLGAIENRKLNWMFPTTMTQEKMIKQIAIDLQNEADNMGFNL